MAMWVALTQHQTGRKFLFEHPAYASSWNTQMVSLVTGFEGVMLITVDLCALGMTDEDERSHCRMTTIMTNDSVVADAFRPYRCVQNHKYASDGGRRSRGAQEHDRQFCEVLMTALKASLLHRDRRDRREPRQLMTLAVRETTTSKRKTLDLTRTSRQEITNAHGDTDQDGESVSSKPGTSIEARVAESVEGSSHETCSARICPTRIPLCRLRRTHETKAFSKGRNPTTLRV